MSKTGSFIFGFLIGAAAGVAAAVLTPDDKIAAIREGFDESTKDIRDKATGAVQVANTHLDDVKDKSVDKLSTLKQKYDNSTDLIKTQLQTFPKQTVNDDSELTDFDDIIIDDKTALGSDNKENEETLDNLDHEVTDK